MDIYKDYPSTLTAPVREAEAVTSGVDTTFAQVPRALYVGGAGDLRVEMLGGQTVTFAAVPGGTLLPLRAARVLASGTTATWVVGLW